MSSIWLYPFILAAGALQALGPPMNGALRQSLTNPWLASTVSFLLVTMAMMALFACLPNPMPTAKGVAGMPWWAPVGGLLGAVAVVAGLLFVDKIGAGPFAGLTITANLVMSLLVDQFGFFGMPVHALNLGRIAGGLLLIAGVALISIF